MYALRGELSLDVIAGAPITDGRKMSCQGNMRDSQPSLLLDAIFSTMSCGTIKQIFVSDFTEAHDGSVRTASS